MSLIIPWGVFTRYVLGTGSQWPEPIAILLMMLFTFIGAAAAYRAGAHIAVTMLTDLLPRWLHRSGEVLVHALMAVVCLFVVWYGTSLCVETMGQSIAELPWLPVGVTYAADPDRQRADAAVRDRAPGVRVAGPATGRAPGGTRARSPVAEGAR